MTGLLFDEEVRRDLSFDLPGSPGERVPLWIVLSCVLLFLGAFWGGALWLTLSLLA